MFQSELELGISGTDRTLAITDLILEPREPVHKKPKRQTEGCGESRGERGSRQQWKQWRGCRRAQGGEGSTALPGVMLKQLLRNEQDTRALCGVVYDTYTVPVS